MIPWHVLKSLNECSIYFFINGRPVGFQFNNIQYVFYMVYNKKLENNVWTGGIRKTQNPHHWIYL